MPRSFPAPGLIPPLHNSFYAEKKRGTQPKSLCLRLATWPNPNTLLKQSSWPALNSQAKKSNNSSLVSQVFQNRRMRKKILQVRPLNGFAMFISSWMSAAKLTSFCLLQNFFPGRQRRKYLLVAISQSIVYLFMRKAMAISEVPINVAS